MKFAKMIAGAFVLSAAMATPAMADDHSGEEIRGQTVDVTFADGSRNSIFFGSTGVATITNTAGQSARANWAVQGDRLCLRAGSATECFAYSAPFQAGRAMPMSSNCNTGSVWTARAVNPPRQEVAPVLGERG